MIVERKLAMQTFCSFVVRLGCALRRVEATKPNPYFITRNVCSPFPAAFPKNYTLKSTGVIPSLAFVAFVLLLSAFPQIIAAIVECIVIFVVAFFIRSTTKNCPMHGNTSTPQGIKTACAGIPERDPVPFVKPFVIRSIYERILIASKWDKFVKWILGLHNCVTLDLIRSTFALFHRSSLKGLVKCSPIITSEGC